MGDDPSGMLIAGRYRLRDRLGSGAMAEVYRAHDETLDRDVAIKLFRAVMDEADTAGRSRRELELQALAQLSHPNLITLFDGSVSESPADGPAFLALELVEGPTLAGVLCRGALPDPQVRQIGAQIADALAYIHERGIVHRDVKPANILLGSDSLSDPSALRARLSDFGIVRLVDESAQVTAADLTVGTAYYLAPEQARSAAVGPEADVYSLGLVLVEALTGARAFEGPLQEVLLARLNRDPHIPTHLPEPWPALLTAMTASDPAHRPPAAHVARTLQSSPASGAVPIAGAAGLAAGLVGEIAAPGAAAAAAARTADLPPAAVPSPIHAPAGSPGPDNRSPRSDPEAEPRRHKLTGVMIAAAVFLAIIAGGGWVLLRPSGHATPQQVHVGTTARTSSAAPADGRHPDGNRRHTHATAPTQPVNRTFSATRAAPSLAHRSSTRPTPAASTTPVPSSTVPPSSTAPPTDPRTTSSPPPTSGAPSTTAAPGTTAAPSTTAGSGTSAGPSTGNAATRSTTPASVGTSSSVSVSAVDVAQQQPISGPG